MSRSSWHAQIPRRQWWGEVHGDGGRRGCTVAAMGGLTYGGVSWARKKNTSFFTFFY
jgi:hypothetical protein